jgi:hypothetical protein
MGRPPSNILRPLCDHCKIRRVKRASQWLCSRACANAARARPLAERFLDFYTPGEPDACWLWTGARERAGYGVIADDTSKRQLRASRLAYEREHGPVPPGMNVCHRCDNPPCVNPAHLFAGTHAENTADMIRKGRTPVIGKRGSASPNAKLTDDDVRAIRHLYPTMSQQAIADRYGVNQDTVSSIVRRETWVDVSD